MKEKVKLRELSIEEIKKEALNVLCEFDKICRENNLKYSLAYGTLLGAIRHKGFIPWDDDIDVIMPRNDYEKFVKLKSNNEYVVKDYRYSSKYYYSYAKFINSNIPIKESYRCDKNLGIFIDIFPVDFFSNEESVKNKLNEYIKKDKFLYMIGNKPNKKQSLFKNIFYFCFRLLIFPFRKRILLKNDKRKISYQNSKSLYFAYIGATSNEQYFEVESWNNLIDVDFEEKKFKAFANYDYVLTKMYGDYMKLPSVEQQISNHNYIAYYK